MSDYDWVNVWNDGQTDEFSEFYGQTVFYDRNSDRFSVRDMSGELPEDTDDGVLWLDFSRTFKIRHDYGVLKMLIPVEDACGKKYRVMARADKAGELFRITGSR